MSDTDTLFQEIATIFAVTVLLDHKQRDQEMVEFCHAVMTINQHLRPGVILPRETILDWYESQKPSIITHLDAADAKNWKANLLRTVPTDALKRLVLASIFTISTCDYELRDEESAFIKTALNIWKTGMPSGADLESVAG